MDSDSQSYDGNSNLSSHLQDSDLQSSLVFSGHVHQEQLKTNEKTGTFRMQDLDLIDSLKASNIRQNPCAFFQDSVQQSVDRDSSVPVREEIRQRLLASDPDEELEINMSSSDLQI